MGHKTLFFFLKKKKSAPIITNRSKLFSPASVVFDGNEDSQLTRRTPEIYVHNETKEQIMPYQTHLCQLNNKQEQIMRSNSQGARSILLICFKRNSPRLFLAFSKRVFCFYCHLTFYGYYTQEPPLLKSLHSLRKKSVHKRRAVICQPCKKKTRKKIILAC